MNKVESRIHESTVADEARFFYFCALPVIILIAVAFAFAL